MAEARVDDDDFKLVTEGFVAGTRGTVVTLPCHLSPETSTESMTIRWFKGTDCIYLYKKGQVTEGRGYDDRLTLNTQELQKGNVSLTLSDYRETDDGVYICQVQHGEQQEETAVTLKSQALITNDDEIRIKTIGFTRAGITATGNAILGYRAFKATSTCYKKVTGVVDGRKVSVIDYPAFFDHFDTVVRKDETGKKLLVEELDRCKRLAAPGPHVVLHVIQMKKNTPEDILVEMLQTVVVLNFSHQKNDMILFTHGGDLDLQYCSVEDCWKAFPKLKKVISKYSSDVCCHVLNTEDPSQVTELMKKIHELVMKNDGYYGTNEDDEDDDDVRKKKQKLLDSDLEGLQKLPKKKKSSADAEKST